MPTLSRSRLRNNAAWPDELLALLNDPRNIRGTAEWLTSPSGLFSVHYQLVTVGVRVHDVALAVDSGRPKESGFLSSRQVPN